MGSQSRPNSQVASRRSSHTGSRQASASGGLVGLPGGGTSALLGDDFSFDIDPALLNHIPEIDAASFNNYLASDAFESNSVDATRVPASNVNATDAGDPNSPSQFFQQGLQNDLGFDLVPVNSQSDHQTQFDAVPIDKAPTGFQWDANVGLESQYNDPYTDLLEPSTGLSAIPGGAYFQPQPSAGYQELAYPHPSSYGYPAQLPYYIQPVPVIEQTGYTPYDYPHDQPPQRSQYDFTDLDPSLHPSREEVEAPRQPKRRREQSELSSEGDAPIIKRPRQAQPGVSPRSKGRPHHSPWSDDSRRRSVISDSSSLGRSVNIAPLRTGQKPKKHEEKTWVRINNSTKGETTRTARINAFADIGTKYKHKPLPVGNWVSSSGFKFQYTYHFEMDGFKKQSMSARQIHEYITQYPGDNLRIWIQITPGDSARRYASEPHSRCIFEQCPNRKWSGKATIEVGSYRVAFDEKHKVYGKGVCDPFDCVGYAHLYCMERFLDFAGICETADVKVDDRSGLKKEPKAIAAFTFLNNKHVYDKLVAEKFVKAAQAGALHRTPEFRDYPNHCDYTRGQPKPHSNTLVAALYETNLSHRTRSQIKQFVNRKILPGAFPIHRGDQEMANIDKMVATLPLYRSNVEAEVHKAGEMARYYDQFFPQVNERINDCVALRAKFKREDDEGNAPTRVGRKRRRIIADDDSDDEPEYPQRIRHGDNNFEEIDLYPFRQPTSGARSSPRKKQRTNYAPDPLTQEQHDIFAQIPQLLPPYTAYSTQPQHSPTKTPTHTVQPLSSPTARNTSINRAVPNPPLTTGRNETPGSRSSPRKKSRTNYAPDPFTQEQDAIFSQIPQLLPPYTAYSTQPQDSPTKTPTHTAQPPTSPPARNTSRSESCTQFFTDNPDVLFDFSTLSPLSPRRTATTPPSPAHPNTPIIDLSRRKSSTLSTGPYASIMKPPSSASPRSRLATRPSARTASFNAQPVTSSKEFAANDPPSYLVKCSAGRRSKRIASLMSSSSSSPLSPLANAPSGCLPSGAHKSRGSGH